MAEVILELVDAKGKREIPMDRDRLTFGRQSDNDVQLDDAHISRRHAEILRQDGGYLVRDLGSRFGTFVNDQMITERPLEHGDRIRLGMPGHAELMFLHGSRERPARRMDTPSSGVSVTDLRQVARLLEGLRALGTVRVLDDVLTLVLDLAIENTRAERGFIMLSNAAGELEFKTTRAAGRVGLPGHIFQTSQVIPQQVFETGETFMSGNLLEDHRAGQHPGTIKIGIRAAMCAALKLAGVTDERDAPQTEPRTIGVLYLDSSNTSAMLSTTTQGALEALATEAARAIEEARLYRESAEKARIDKELEDAARIQAALLPPPHWSKDRIEVAGRTLPCRAIGGDFFDYFELPDGRLGLSLADVSGKGPPAAMLATRLQAMLSSLAEAGGGPGETLARLNQSLLRRSIAPRFATLAYAVLYPDGRLGACNAGHNPSIVVGQDGSIRQLSRGGLMLGLFEQPMLEEDWVELQPGDTLIFFSDGVTEALNAVGEQFGEERLETCLARAPGLSAEGMVECLLHHVNEFAAEVPQFDDVTVLVVKFAAG